jgi:hypothetical protein
MTKKRLKITPARCLVAIALTTIAFLALWETQYHGPGESRDLRYQARKLGVYPMDVDQATGSMIADVHRDSLVIGKTQDELIKKFGYVTALENASGYVKYCYFNSPYYGTPVLMLRKSNWMVLMKDGRATNLILVKGC